MKYGFLPLLITLLYAGCIYGLPEQFILKLQNKVRIVQTADVVHNEFIKNLFEEDDEEDDQIIDFDHIDEFKDIQIDALLKFIQMASKKVLVAKIDEQIKKNDASNQLKVCITLSNIANFLANKPLLKAARKKIAQFVSGDFLPEIATIADACPLDVQKKIRKKFNKNNLHKFLNRQSWE